MGRLVMLKRPVMGNITPPRVRSNQLRLLLAIEIVEIAVERQRLLLLLVFYPFLV
jgi:hypothetical protein